MKMIIYMSHIFVFKIKLKINFSLFKLYVVSICYVLCETLLTQVLKIFSIKMFSNILFNARSCNYKTYLILLFSNHNRIH